MTSQENTGEVHNGSAAESLKASYTHAREAAKQAVGEARQRATAYYEQGKAKCGDLSESTEQLVREHPIKSVLVAAGVGLLLGMLIRRL